MFSWCKMQFYSSYERTWCSALNSRISTTCQAGEKAPPIVKHIPTKMNMIESTRRAFLTNVLGIFYFLFTPCESRKDGTKMRNFKIWKIVKSTHNRFESDWVIFKIESIVGKHSFRFHRGSFCAAGKETEGRRDVGRSFARAEFRLSVFPLSKTGSIQGQGQLESLNNWGFEFQVINI